MDIPYTEQKGQFDCSLACKKSIDRYMGENEDQIEINNDWKKKLQN